MGYRERLKDFELITPDKETYVFNYGDLETKFDKKTSESQFADTPGTNVQDFGLGRRSFSLTVWLSGPDYDREATRFDRSAAKPGISKFAHPNQGEINVVLTGWTRADALRSASNQAVYRLELVESVEIKIPFRAANTQLTVTDAGDEYAEAAISAFEKSFLADTIELARNAAARIKSFNNRIRSAVRGVTGAVNAVENAVSQTVNEINSTIDTLVTTPGILAKSMIDLVQLPSRGLNSITSRMKTYVNLIESEKLLGLAGVGADYRNAAAEKELLLSALLRGMNDAAMLVSVGQEADGQGGVSEVRVFNDGNSEIVTRNDALEVAAILAATYIDNSNYLSGLENPTAQPGTQFFVDGDAMKAIKQNTSLASKETVRLSFTLLAELRYEVPAETTLIHLAHRLYGSSSVDDRRRIIDANMLTGLELLRIPSKKEIIYYA